MGLAMVLAPQMVSAQSSGEDNKKKEEQEEPEIDAHAELTRANKLASRGAITRSVTHYENVLKAAPDRYPSAYYNLAGVMVRKEKYKRALLLYEAYRWMGGAGSDADGKKGIAKIKAKIWNKKLATLSVDIEPEQKAKIVVDGLVIAQNRDIEGMTVLAGEYTVESEVVDHFPEKKTVTLEKEGEESVKLEPRMKVFYGKAAATVNEEGATIKFKAEELKSSEAEGKTVVKKSPLEEPVELATGKWLVEVKKKNFHRWVRYIDVRRDEKSSVQVKLEEKLPEEIR
jgi:tetratricopeptide (TPR) repeat protein